jgi:hypothetical protein
MNQRSALAKIQITKDIHINNNQIMKKGTVLNLPHREETRNYTLVMEYQDRSFFFESYVSLYCIDGDNISGIPLQEGKHFQILNKEKGKISKLTQTEFELGEDIQIGLF